MGEQFSRLNDAVDAYEQKFAEQVKNVRDARSVIEEDRVRTREAQSQLSSRAEAMRLQVKGIVDDFWIETKQVTEGASVSARAVFDETELAVEKQQGENDQRLANDLEAARSLFQEQRKLNREKVALARSKSERQLQRRAEEAQERFDRDADIAIQEAARLGAIERGTVDPSAVGHENDSNAAAAAVKKKAIEAQDLLARQTAEDARVVADAAAEAVELAAGQAEESRLKVAALAADAAARVVEYSRQARERVLGSTLEANQGVVAAVNVGTTLADLDRALLGVQVSVARYLQLNKNSLADAALANVSAALEIIDAIRRGNRDERMTLQLGGVRKQLLEYQNIFRETIANAEQVVAKRAQINADIKEQKEVLRLNGERLIELATQITDGTWDAIAGQSRQLQTTGSDAQNMLTVLVIVGVLLGAFVLYAVPRPILASINQLLMGAQRVAGGDLTQPVNVDSRDELGQLAATFDHMRTNLMALVDRIQRASVQISTTVNEIQAASSQQSATATEQAGALNEFSVTLREIAQSAEQLASNAGVVAESSDSVASRVADANSRSTRMMESMNAIGDSTRQTSDRIKSLNDQMDSITDAVTSISGIADQTTLLSLNAAIEANKAGEMGKGFSVVATEIRRLSDRSIESAAGISGMVRDIQRATESSVVSMDKSSEEIRVGIDLVQESTATMDDVNLNMSEITSRTRDIAVGVNQQSTSSLEAQQTVTELLSASNVAAQAARQTSSAAYELNAMATQLSNAVAAFRI